jgi:hypothetical protein
LPGQLNDLRQLKKEGVMATANTPNPAASSEAKLREVKVTLDKDQDALIVNDATTALLDKAFVMQDNYDNESKFRRAFVLDAVRAHVKAECSRIITAWDAAIAKTSKLHPLKNRGECEATLLESKKAQGFKSMVDVAVGLKRELS